MNPFMKNIKLAKPVVLLACSVILLSACNSGGGSSGTDNAPPSGTMTGTFLDSAVDGLTYSATPSGSVGTTQNGGKFACRSGDTVSFSVGDVNLGQTACQDTVTPVDLVMLAKDETDPVVTNIARFLLSLDSDHDPSNGITIDSATAAEVAGRGIVITDPGLDFDTNADIQALFTALGITPVTVVEAQNHLRSTLIGFTQDELAGKTFQVTDNDYSSCTLNVTFHNNSTYTVEGNTFDYILNNGSIVVSDINSRISVQSRNGSEITIIQSIDSGSFVVETGWPVDFSSLNNSATALKDWFITNGFWPGSTITSDGRVTNKAASFDGAWWIDNNVFYFAYPEDTGCVDYKAYKLVNNILMFATDAAHTSTSTMIETIAAP